MRRWAAVRRLPIGSTSRVRRPPRGIVDLIAGPGIERAGGDTAVAHHRERAAVLPARRELPVGELRQRFRLERLGFVRGARRRQLRGRLCGHEGQGRPRGALVGLRRWPRGHQLQRRWHAAVRTTGGAEPTSMPHWRWRSRTTSTSTSYSSTSASSGPRTSSTACRWAGTAT